MYDILELKHYELESFDVSEKGKYYVLKVEGDRYIKVSDEARVIIDNIDGKSTLKQIASKVRMCGLNYTDSEIEKFIKENLIGNDLVKNQISVKKNISSKLWYHKKIINGNSLNSISRILTWFCNKNVVSVAIFLTVIFFPLVIYNNRSILFMQIDIFNLNSVGILALVFLSFLIHELGHIAVTLKYKRKVGALGVGIYLFRPVFYTDLSDTWGLNRYQRVCVDCGGVYFQLLLNLMLIIIYLFNGNSTILISIMLILISIIGNLNPVLRFDGYWILTDFLGIVNIDKRVFDYLKYKIKYFRKKEKFEYNINYPKKIEMIFIIYAMIYLLFTIFAIVFGLTLVFVIVKNPGLLIKESIYPIYRNIINFNLSQLLKSVNNSIITIFPLIYLVLFIITLVKNALKSRGGSNEKK